MQKLRLSNNQLTAIKNLENLTNLRELNLTYNRLTKIENLEGLKNLRLLNLFNNWLTGIRNLESLTNLQNLDLSYNQLAEIKNLECLKNLCWLNLYNNRITEIKNLESLESLEVLHLGGNPITEVNQLNSLVNSPALKELYLYGIKKNNLHIPIENFGKHYTDNSLPLLKAYFESIKKGASYSQEVPIILVGNSTAGKTSLLYFIKERIFPPPQDHSTHGIEPDLWQPAQSVLENFENTNSLKDVQFYFWDFGGQEYYHATHRLFFSKDAVYVLVWDKATNKQGVEKLPIRLLRLNGTVEEVEQPVELFPYTYWLDTIRFFAPDKHRAPIIIVQNKLDTAGHIKDRLSNTLFDQFGITDAFHLSVKEANSTQPGGTPYRDFEYFVGHLLSIVKGHVMEMARETHWESAKNLLNQHKDDRVWTLHELLNNLRTLDPDIRENNMASYTNSLCSNGFMFYYPEVEELKNCIFINPAWVTETIYAILDEEVRENGGEFDRKQVETKSGQQHAGAFIALMKKFELIFENPETGLFIAPQYLPAQLSDVISGRKEWNRLRVRFKDFVTPDYYVRFPDFMPRSIMLRFLAAYGAKAIGQNYWKNGIAFMLEGRESTVLYEAASKCIKIFVEVADEYVQRLILDTLLQLTENKDTLEIALDKDNFVQYSELKKYYRNNEVAAVSGKLISTVPLRHFAEDIETVKKTGGINRYSITKQVKIFVSYAHEDEAMKELLLKTHLKAIQNNYDEGLLAWTDAGIKPELIGTTK